MCAFCVGNHIRPFVPKAGAVELRSCSAGVDTLLTCRAMAPHSAISGKGDIIFSQDERHPAFSCSFQQWTSQENPSASAQCARLRRNVHYEMQRSEFAPSIEALMRHAKSMLLFTMILSSSLSSAQVLSRWGIKVGLTMSNIAVTDRHPAAIGWTNEDIDYVHGQALNPAISVFADPVRLEWMDIEAELSYLRCGASQTTPITYFVPPDYSSAENTTVTNELGLYILQLGVHLEPKYNVGAVTVYSIAGPKMSFLLSVADIVATGSQLRRILPGYTLGAGLVAPGLFKTEIFAEVTRSVDAMYFYKGYYSNLWNSSWLFSIGTTL